MEGKKPYSSTLDGHCCLSSGPRGVALIPTFAVTTDAEGVVVNLFDSGTAELKLREGLERSAPARLEAGVTLTLDTLYPADGRVRLRLEPAAKETFALKLRVPSWCRNAVILVNGKPVTSHRGADGYVSIKRKWSSGDLVEMQLQLEARVIVGDHKNSGKVAILYGPLVLAADEALLGVNGLSLDAVTAKGSDLAALDVTPEPASAQFKTWRGAQLFRINALAQKNAGSLKPGAPVQIRLVPFADAGQTGTPYKVWLPLYQAPQMN